MGGFQSSSEYGPAKNGTTVCVAVFVAVGVFVDVTDGVTRGVGVIVGDTDADAPTETEGVGVHVLVDDGKKLVTLKETTLLDVTKPVVALQSVAFVGPSRILIVTFDARPAVPPGRGKRLTLTGGFVPDNSTKKNQS